MSESLSALIEQTQGRRDATWHDFSVHVINEAWGSLVVAHQGAQLLHFAPKGQRNWLWTTPTPKPAPGAIRGGIPLCWPWFGDADTAGEPAHGRARTATWRLDAVDEHEEGVELHLTPTEPLDSQLTPRVVIQANAKRLNVELITEHTGDTPTSFTQALHTYLSVDDAFDVRIEGLAGARYLDKLEGFKEKTQQGELGIRGGLDRIYHSSRPLLLRSGSAQRRIAKQGSDSSVVWHPGDQRPGDIPAEENTHFVCVEAACTQLDRVWLAPGSQHLLSQHLSLEE
ncbi:D-hexose-6-phosphate mutarotase [Larsenimonas salina]|uniref:D-hexose-6-phosphate mutarotase n=1 Tax=Larsenimonas salina TaxID=1295565 RepID=UPI0020740AC5|nr:D-hexose-6-phosphate mutarotase [Larsenimonas salina]MCM5704996.1 D-hexose-6-phosphate mutarotase [Larsenimonas salina]